MALNYLDYKTIPASKRSAAGHAYIRPLRDALRNPLLTAPEIAVLEGEIQKINDWINGSLAVTPPAAVPEFVRP